MCTSVVYVEGLRYACLADEEGCTAHVSDDVSGELISWVD